jgi:hypothetical protein
VIAAWAATKCGDMRSTDMNFPLSVPVAATASTMTIPAAAITKCNFELSSVTALNRNTLAGNTRAPLFVFALSAARVAFARPFQ